MISVSLSSIEKQKKDRQMKKAVFLTILLSLSVHALSLYVAVDNNGSKPFLREKVTLKHAMDKAHMRQLNIEEVVLFNNSGQVKKYKLAERPVSLNYLKRIKMNDGIIHTLEMVLGKHFVKGDVVVFVSSMDYRDVASATRSQSHRYNDAWITSEASPLSRLLASHPNKPFNGAKIVILDPSHDIRYRKSRARFFAYYFARLGGRMVYYGSLDGDRKRLFDYLRSSKKLEEFYQGNPLRNESVLMLDDAPVQYRLP
jgi:hypothetical protein